MRLNEDQIRDMTGGTIAVPAGDAGRMATGLSWDSRSLEIGDLYAALPGDRVDGHDFVAAALDAGAAGALVSAPPSREDESAARACGAFIILVDDAAAAIVEMARAWREMLSATVVALTGSSGKTTTKNLVRAVLSTEFRVVATEGNQNNELGVPRTVLRADADTQVLVVEMGMRGSGQLTDLCSFVKPDVGAITNVGESHIELLGSREGIARAKGELIQSLPDGAGCAVLNASDGFTPFIRSHARTEGRGIEVVLYDGSGAANQEACVFATGIALDGEGRPSFMLHVADACLPCTLALRGTHNVGNACCAAAIAHHLGMGIEAIASALQSVEAMTGRQDVFLTDGGVMLVDDSYNANPDSMRASLETFAALDVEGRHIAVLGDMGELGDFAQDAHEGIGRLAARLGLDRLLCVGASARFIAAAARDASMGDDAIIETDSIDEVLADLADHMEPGDAVLVKASHSVGLERVVRGLVS